MEKKNNAIGDDANNLINPINIDSLLFETSERNKRYLNLVFFGVAEHDGNDDETTITNLLIKIGIDCMIKRLVVKRMGNDNARKPRPLVVTMDSRADIILAIKNKRGLPRNILIGGDQIKMQHISFRQLKDQVAEHNRKNPNNPRTIKYAKGSCVFKCYNFEKKFEGS